MSYDVALLTYVLHHAAGDTISLLKEAKRVARKYVIVLEDVIDSEDDAKNAFAHDPRGTFATAASGTRSSICSVSTSRASRAVQF